MVFCDEIGSGRPLRQLSWISDSYFLDLVDVMSCDWTKRLRRGMGGAVWVCRAPCEDVDPPKILV
jgi:hypothetical protein